MASVAKKRSDSKQHLPCQEPGCPRLQCAKGLCRLHWKKSKPWWGSPVERRAKFRLSYNKLPPPTRPEASSCEACGVVLVPVGRRSEIPILDHDHERNVFRGWLCDKCNRIAGRTKADIERIHKVLMYLNNFYGQEIP